MRQVDTSDLDLVQKELEARYLSPAVGRRLRILRTAGDEIECFQVDSGGESRRFAIVVLNEDGSLSILNESGETEMARGSSTEVISRLRIDV